MVIVGQRQVIFKKVAVSEKKMIFREAANDRTHLSIKGFASDELFHLIAIQDEKDEVLLCHHTADSKEVSKDQKVVVNFVFNNERYFFHSDLSFQLGWAVLRIDGELFQLQRRENARIELPYQYEAAFILTQHCGKSYFIDCRLKDISAGGFKFEMLGEAVELRVGDRIKGSLRLGVRRPMEFEVEVRYAQKREFEGKIYQTAGVQFLNRDQLLENRLLSLMMDLQRELFLKFSEKA